MCTINSRMLELSAFQDHLPSIRENMAKTEK
jgi:hypothetical protein